MGAFICLSVVVMANVGDVGKGAVALTSLFGVVAVIAVLVQHSRAKIRRHKGKQQQPLAVREISNTIDEDLPYTYE
jgi:hypothetical protein